MHLGSQPIMAGQLTEGAGGPQTCPVFHGRGSRHAKPESWLGYCQTRESTTEEDFTVCMQASKRCAGGIVEALEHFKLVPQ